MSFFLINKPLHFTSFDVVKYLKGRLKISKIGHTGTLDPLATGVLLIATGKDTKLIPYFEKDTKEYYFSANFDGKTESYDLGTKVNYITKKDKNNASKRITKEKIESLLKEKFTGEIYQIPPKYSALKISGKRALDRALKGENFEMQKRFCNILKIELIDYKYPTASFMALVSPGTYIRSIANDLGIELGTGGYVTELKRTKIGNLDLNSAQNLENFDKNRVLDIKKLFKGRKFVNCYQDKEQNCKELEPPFLSFEVITKINDGMKVKGKFDFKVGEEFFVFNGKNITNIIEYDGNMLIPKKKL